MKLGLKILLTLTIALLSSNLHSQVILDRSNETDSTLPFTTAFGENVAIQPTPITQISAQYGLLEKTAIFLINGGTAKAENGLFVSGTGTNANSLGSILTRRQLFYRAGQGSISRFTALFDDPVSGNAQQAGLITATDSFAFGYLGTSFGIAHTHDGKTELQELTITTPSTGSEDATITIDAVAFTVPLTAGTVQHNAFEIANSLTAQVPAVDFSSNNDQVVARSLLATSLDTFAFSSGTAIATWNEIVDGLPATLDFIPQASWNQNVFKTLNQQTGNVYQIQYQYLGFGEIDFAIENPVNGKLELVHKIKYGNKNVFPSVSNPTFRVGWSVSNSTNTTNIELKGGSAAAFVEGLSVRTESPRAFVDTNLSVPVGTFQNIFSIRNRIVFGNIRNRAEMFGLSLTAATDSNKAAVIEVCIGSTVMGDLDFQYVDKENSIMEIATDEGEVTDCGRLVSSFVIPAASGVVVNLEELAALLLPGEIMTVGSSITSGASSAVTASIIWQEDI